MSIAYNGMPIGVTASSKIILLTNIIFQYNPSQQWCQNSQEVINELVYQFSVDILKTSFPAFF